MNETYLNDISMEDRMVAGLVYNLKGITEANGFAQNIGDVLEDPPVAPAAIQNFPGVVIAFGEELVEAESIDETYLKVPVFLYCHVRETDRPSRAVRLIKRDIQRMLGLYWNLPGEDGQSSCGLAKYAGALPFARVNGAPQAGVRIKVEITYHQLIRDQTQN